MDSLKSKTKNKQKNKQIKKKANTNIKEEDVERKLCWTLAVPDKAVHVSIQL